MRNLLLVHQYLFVPSSVLLLRLSIINEMPHESCQMHSLFLFRVDGDFSSCVILGGLTVAQSRRNLSVGAPLG